MHVTFLIKSALLLSTLLVCIIRPAAAQTAECPTARPSVRTAPDRIGEGPRISRRRTRGHPPQRHRGETARTDPPHHRLLQPFERGPHLRKEDRLEHRAGPQLLLRRRLRDRISARRTHRLDRTDSVTAPSNVSIYGNFTTQKFVLLRFSGDNLFNHNRQRLSYSGAFVYFPGAFGIGYEAGKEGYAQDLTTTMGTVNVSYCTSLAGRFYVGVSGGLNYTGAAYRSSGMTEYLEGIRDGRYEKPGGQRGELYDLWLEGRYLPEKQDPFSNYIAATGDRPNALNAHVGIFAQYDTRDVTFNASKGVFVKAEAKWYPGGWATRAARSAASP